MDIRTSTVIRGFNTEGYALVELVCLKLPLLFLLMILCLGLSGVKHMTFLVFHFAAHSEVKSVVINSLFISLCVRS